jgi:hypothetical protein
MTMTCLQTPTDSVSRLRTALKSLSAAGLTEAYLAEASLRSSGRLHHDFAIFAHAHQEHCGHAARSAGARRKIFARRYWDGPRITQL